MLHFTYFCSLNQIFYFDGWKCLSCKVSVLTALLQLSRYKGGPALPRKLISQGIEHKHYNVEVYPLRLKVIDSRDNSMSIVKLSKKVPVDFVAGSLVFY